jgi:hypothetical protein
MYILISNGAVEKYPYSIGALRKDNPNVSFPKNPSAETLAEWGVYPCETLSAPEHDRLTQTTKQNAPSQNEQGDWVITWTVEQLPIEDAAERVRRERDRLLDGSDWVVIRARELGQDVPREWFDYRSDLRNIPQQDGFPHDVVWPTHPDDATQDEPTP